MTALALDLTPQRRRLQRRRRRCAFGLQLLLSVALAWAVTAAMRVGLQRTAGVQRPAQLLREQVRQSERALAAELARGGQLRRQRDEVTDWRRRRVLLPRLLRQLELQPALRIESIVQLGDVLRVQGVSAQPAAAHVWAQSLRASGRWQQLEWMGWRGDAGRQRFTLCASASSQPRCEDAEAER